MSKGGIFMEYSLTAAQRWRLLALVAALLFFVLAAAQSAQAAGIFSDAALQTLRFSNQGQGFTTELVAGDGETARCDGVLDTASLADSALSASVSTYTVRTASGETCFSVNLKEHDAASDALVRSFSSSSGAQVFHGYYAITFTVSEADNTHAFLTGLSESNVAMVQDAVIEAVRQHTTMDLEDLAFIDTEKRYIAGDGDDLLCWAASASNVLQYTGWTVPLASAHPDEAGNFANADRLFDLYAEHFTDNGGLATIAYSWLFNGTNMMQTSDDSTHTNVKDYGESGAYLSDYNATRLVDTYDMSNHRVFANAAQALNSGSGVSMGISWCDENGESLGLGHGITLWGYVWDADYAASDASCYQAVVVSDSDSDMIVTDDRGQSPNKLSLSTLTPYSKGAYDSWTVDAYTIDEGTCVLTALTLLPAYSNELPKETSTAASKDLFTTANLCVNDNLIGDAGLSLSTDSSDQEPGAAYGDTAQFFADDTIYVTPYVFNDSTQPFSGGFDYTVQLDGKRLASARYDATLDAMTLSDSSDMEQLTLQNLAPGRHTLTFTVNPSQTAREAYYYDDTTSVTIEVQPRPASLDAVQWRVALGDVHYDQNSMPTFPARFTFDGLDALLAEMGAAESDCTLYAAYVDSDGTWGSWQRIDNDSLTQADLPADGARVRLRLHINGDSGSVDLYPNASAYDLSYLKGSLSAEDAPAAYSDCATNATGFANGEAITLSIGDASTTSHAPLSYTLCVSADNGFSEPVTLYSGSGTLPEKTKEVRISRWTTPLTGGIYTLTATLTTDYGTMVCDLGTLPVQEAASTTVTTTDGTVDAYDGQTSLAEAVAVARDGDTIDLTNLGTAAPDAWGCYCDTGHEAIVIDKAITIVGSSSRLSGSWGNTIFHVTKDGSLTLSNVCLSDSYNSAIINDGGSVQLNQCTFLFNSTGAGADVSSQGGSLRINNCSFGRTNLEASASTGSRIEMAGGTLQMSNSIVFDCQHADAIHLRDGAQATLLYTTLIDTTGHGLLAEDTSHADLLGCVSLANSDGIDGDVALYGCYVDAVSPRVQCDDHTITDGVYDAFFGSLSDSGDPLWSIRVDLPAYDTDVCALAGRGVWLRDESGTIALSSNGSDWSDTDVAAVFDDSAYHSDLIGTASGRRYGALAYTGSPFSDVANDAWYAQPVGWVYDRDLMLGTADGLFSPDEATSRAMLVTILWRVAGAPAASSASTFADVAPDAWYADAIAWAGENDIVSGYSADRFGPNDPVTREQFAAILYNLSGSDASADLSAFADAASVSAWAAPAMQWAVATNLLHGYDDNTLHPQGATTRSETAAILSRHLDA